MKALLFAANEDLAVTVLQSLAIEAVRVDVMSPRRMRWAGLSRYSGKSFPCKLEHLLEPDRSFADVINRYCSSEQIDIIIPVDVLPTACLAKIRPMIAVPIFPIPTVDQILQLNHKWRFKQLLDQLDIQTPQTILINSREEIPNSDITFPIMVKPVDREHGIGVKRLSSKDDMEMYFSDVKHNGNWPLLIQEYIPGDDICISVLCEHGEVLYWTIQKRLERGEILFIEHSEFLQSVRTICEKLNYTGAAHFDARIDDRDNTIKFLECNPRFWGSLTASTFAGVNFAVLGIDLKLKHRKADAIIYHSGLRLPDRATNLSIIPLLIKRYLPLNQSNIHCLFHTLCDPLLVCVLIGRQFRKRLAKIFIPGSIRRRQRRRKQMAASVPPLSATEAYAYPAE